MQQDVLTMTFCISCKAQYNRQRMTHLKYITVYVAKYTIYIEVHCCVNKYIHNVTTAIAAPQMVVKPI